MPVIEVVDGCGEVRREFRPATTTERRRDRAVRACLRAARTRVEPELYAAVWESLPKTAAPAVVALAYQMVLARRTAAEAVRSLGPAAIAAAGRQVREAVAAVAGRDPLALPAKKPEPDEDVR